jgi:Urease accessory protein UreH
MPAQLWMRFEESDGATLLRLKQTPPWRVIRGFPAAGAETLAHLHNVSGGILDNDDLLLQIEVGPAARAQITTTGATRIYRSRAATAVARQRTEVTVGARAVLEYLPDPLIPYARSRFHQSAIIDLQEDATLFWWETIAPGREAAGEVFHYDAIRGALELRACGEPVAIERYAIEPAIRHPVSPARLAHFRYFSSFYVCQAGRQSWLELESQLGELAGSLSRPGEVLWGVSTLTACGLAIRGVALAGRDLAPGLIAFWRVAKWYLCGRAANIPRKIN